MTKTQTSPSTCLAAGAPPKWPADKTIDALKTSMPLAKLEEAYALMLRCRRFEEKAAELYQQGQIRGFCHLYIGQEAVLAGCRAASKSNDDYITSYRCHAHGVAVGADPKALMAELTGKAAGVSKGKGGSMHMFDPAAGYWGGHGIVGAQVPLGAGIAWARKYMGDDRICLTFMGDGAVNEGAVYEAFNIAALWGLPALFIIENNQYGMGTSVARAAAGTLHTRGESFGIKGQRVNGMDFFAVYNAVQGALERIRAGGKPELIEMVTYRYRGHSMSDPGKYRERSEIEEWRDSSDPITSLGKVLLERGVKEAKLKELDKTVKAEMAEVEEFALSSPVPTDAELMTDIVPEGASR